MQGVARGRERPGDDVDRVEVQIPLCPVAKFT